MHPAGRDWAFHVVVAAISRSKTLGNFLNKNPANRSTYKLRQITVENVCLSSAVEGVYK